MSPNEKKKFSRKDLKRPDEFVAKGSQFSEILQTHRKTILIGLGIAGAVLVGVAAGYVFIEERARNSSEAMNDVLEKLGRPVRTVQLFTGTTEGEQDEESFSSQYEKDEALSKAFGEARAKASIGSIAKLTRLGEAQSLLGLGKHAEASKAYAEFIDDPSGAEAFLFLAYEGMGMSLEGQKKLDDAMKQYKALEAVNDGKYSELGLYHQARILVELGRKDEAKQTYTLLAKKITESPKMTPMLGYIQERIAGKEGVPEMPSRGGTGDPGFIMGPGGKVIPTGGGAGGGGTGLDPAQMEQLQKMLEGLKLEQKAGGAAEGGTKPGGGGGEQP